MSNSRKSKKKKGRQGRKADPVWDLRSIRKYSWDTAFRKGWKSWLAMVAVCFLFSFVGVSSAEQTKGIDYFDSFISAEDEDYEQNIDYLKEYVMGRKVIKDLPETTRSGMAGAIEFLSRSNIWVIRALASNAAYFERNPGEVIVNLLIIGLIMLVVRFFIQNAMKVGLFRFTMENRQQERVRFRRIFTPFHFRTIPNVIWVMFRYYLEVFLWSLLLGVPGIWKAFQLAEVPYILAENPKVPWKEAKRLSKEMTSGYKWKMFVAKLSYIYIWLLRLIPVAGILVAVPLDEQLDSEMYFVLRNRAEIRSPYLVESAFADAPYIKKANRKKGKLTTVPEPEYVLDDVNTKTAHKTGQFHLDYSLTDVVFLFFVFCLIGYVWEVTYWFVNHGVLVNRGTLYGPWIPIYGCGGLAIVLLLDRFKEKKIKLFLMTMLICAILEYAASFALEFIFNSSYWDYKHMLINVNGRICLAGLLAFGVGGLFGVYIAAPAISRAAGHFSKRTQNTVAIVLLSLFAIDLVCCALFGFNAGTGVGGVIT